MSILGTIAGGTEPLLEVTGAAAAGLLLGAAFYCGLWWNLRLLLLGRAVVPATALLMARFAAVAALMICLARQGEFSLAAATLGFLAARIAVVRLLVGGRA